MRRIIYKVIPLMLVILTVFSMTACSLLPDPNAVKKPSTVTIDDLMQKKENKGSASQSISELPTISGEPSAISGELLYTLETQTVGDDVKTVKRVYNLELGKLLVSIDDGRRVGFVSSELVNGASAEGIYYVINENVMYIYNADGTRAIAVNYSEDHGTIFGDSLNGFSYDGTEYYVRDGAVVYEGDNPLASDYFNAAEEYLGRYYYLNENDEVFVFDAQGKPVYEFHKPSYVEDSHIFVLGNGNLFIQYIYETIEGEEYDYIQHGKMHKVVSIFVNLERNTVTEPVVSYLVFSVTNAFTDEDFSKQYTDRVDNVAQIVDIENKRIDENSPARYIVLSDNLIELFAMQDLVSGALDIIRISNDRNLVVTASGNLLVAGDCTLIGQLNNYRCITEKFIITSGKIYDHDLQPLFDLMEGGYTYRTSVGNHIILSKVVNDIPCLYLFKGDKPVFICAYTDYVTCFEGYAIKEGEVYHYYDESGKKLITMKEKIEWIDYTVEDNGRVTHVGYAKSPDGEITYYQLSFDTLTTLS